GQRADSLLAATAVPVRARLAHGQGSRTGRLCRARKPGAKMRAEHALTSSVFWPCGANVSFHRIGCTNPPSSRGLPVGVRQQGHACLFETGIGSMGCEVTRMSIVTYRRPVAGKSV